MGCFSFEELLAGCEVRELPEPIRRHVSGENCPSCSRRLRLVQRMLALLPGLALEPVPARVLSAALGVPGRERRPLRYLLRLVPRTLEALPALRSSAPSQRLLYRAEPYELDLALLDEGVLLGEVFSGSDTPGAPLEEPLPGSASLYGAEGVQHAELDRDGCFRLPGVRPGAHVLVVDRAATQLVVPDLEIPDRRT